MEEDDGTKILKEVAMKWLNIKVVSQLTIGEALAFSIGIGIGMIGIFIVKLVISGSN